MIKLMFACGPPQQLQDCPSSGCQDEPMMEASRSYL